MFRRISDETYNYVFQPTLSRAARINRGSVIFVILTICTASFFKLEGY